MRFHLPFLDHLSFWLGFIISALIWWLASLTKPLVRNQISQFRSKSVSKRDKNRGIPALSELYLQSIFIKAQGMHLAASLFSLDEIIQPPRFLIPPRRIEPGAPIVDEGILDSSPLHLASWPELAAIYHAPTIGVTDILTSGIDVVITGRPGTGKSTTLAYIASRLACRDLDSGHSSSGIPFLIHVADLDLPADEDNLLSSIIKTVGDISSTPEISLLSSFIRKTFADGQAILLVDGFDELPQSNVVSMVDFLQLVKNTFPKTQIITTASPIFLDGLIIQNFLPLTLAAWDEKQYYGLLNCWSRSWQKHNLLEDLVQTEEQIDSILINGWMGDSNSFFTPLELTLKIWGICSGDVQGSDVFSAIEAYINRLTPDNVSRQAVEFLGSQNTVNTLPFFDFKETQVWLKSWEPHEEVGQSTEPFQEGDASKNPSLVEAVEEPPSRSLINNLVDCGLLITDRNNRLRFSHPVINYYLAGKSLTASNVDRLLDQPFWIGKDLTLQFMSRKEDASTWIESLLSRPDKPLYTNLLNLGRWLRYSPGNASWGELIINKLLKLVYQEDLPLVLRFQAITAILSQDHVTTSHIDGLKKMMVSNSSSLQQLATIGSGIIKNETFIDQLADLTRSPASSVRRAACLGLNAIGTQAAIDALAGILLNGDDQQRRTAAEALALNDHQGHDILKEGAFFKEDPMVRRASAYGLGLIKDSWALDLLIKLERDDGEWIVRNVASEMIEQNRIENKYLQNPLPPPTESPWLIAFAGKHGMGVSPDKSPIELLLLALKTGSFEEKKASLSYLGAYRNEKIFVSLYEALYSGDLEIRDSIYNTLSTIAASGVQLPDPAILEPVL